MNQDLIAKKVKMIRSFMRKRECIQFLKNLGILERAELIAKKMNFSSKANLYHRLKRLLSPNLMGSLFKVILAYNFKKNNYLGFK